MNWYVEGLKKYAVFQGRASRSEFWYFTLFDTLISGMLMAIMYWAVNTGNIDLGRIFYIVIIVYTLGLALPRLGIMVRRLHDTGRSGWWYFIIFIPLVGVLVLLYFLIQKSQQGSNIYGDNPKKFINSDNHIDHTGSDYMPPAGVAGNTQKYPEASNILYTLIPENSIYPKITLNNHGCVTIGRSSENDIQISNEYVSGKHACFGIGTDTSVKGYYLYIIDYGSTNGTYLDGRKLNPYEETHINESMRIILGSEEVVYRIQEV